MIIVAATNNAHKLHEFRQILGPRGIDILAANDVGGIPDVDEDADTFAGNAMKKAVAGAAHVGRPVLADDSGLEVIALDCEPGVHSARYAGPAATDADRMAKLLGRLAPHRDRSARFVCVIAVATPDGPVGNVRGEVPGVIAPAPRGSNGFGYDPIFAPTPGHRTFAELSAAEKDAISHRGNALAEMLAQNLLAGIG